jgi:hypothetical protein
MAQVVFLTRIIINTITDVTSSSLPLHYMRDYSIHTVNHVIHILNGPAIISKVESYLKRRPLSLSRKFCLYDLSGINLDYLIYKLTQSEACNRKSVVMMTAIKITYLNLSKKITLLYKRIHKLI